MATNVPFDREYIADNPQGDWERLGPYHSEKEMWEDFYKKISSGYTNFKYAASDGSWTSMITEAIRILAAVELGRK